MTLTRLVLAAYPPSWRERYGAELAELTGPAPDRIAQLDLVRGAVLAWLRPVVPPGAAGIRQRRLAATSTVHVAWCAGFLFTMAFGRAVNDPPSPGVSHALLALQDAAVGVGCVLALLVAVVVGLRLVLRCRRSGDIRTLLPLAVPIGLLAVVLVTAWPLTLVARDLAAHPSPAAIVAVLAWLGILVLFVAAAAVAPVLVLRSPRVTDRDLTLTSRAAGGVAVVLVVLAVQAGAQLVAIAGRAPAVAVGQGLLAAAGLLVAASVAAVSAARGARA